MGRLRVRSLAYKAVLGQGVTYAAPPLTRENQDFRIRLEETSLTAEPKGDFDSPELAREAIDPYLRAWEVLIALEYGFDEMRFEYTGADVVDLDQPNAMLLSDTVRISESVHAVLSVTRHQYPDPPDNFALSPVAEMMWYRYRQYRDGREPLPSAAYFCLTVVNWSAGSQAQASVEYNVSQPVLRKLGELTSRGGDPRVGRKALEAGAQPWQYDPAQLAWIEAATKALIRRLGEYAANPSASLPQITMADLPTLP